jgi:hypothetical protein
MHQSKDLNMSSVFRTKNMQDTGIDNVFFLEKSCRKMYTIYSAVQRQQRKSDVMTSFGLIACSAVYYQVPNCRFLITITYLIENMKLEFSKWLRNRDQITAVPSSFIQISWKLKGGWLGMRGYGPMKKKAFQCVYNTCTCWPEYLSSINHCTWVCRVAIHGCLLTVSSWAQRCWVDQSQLELWFGLCRLCASF